VTNDWIAAIAVSHIVGLTLIVVSDTPWPLAFAVLNFTAAIQNGTAERYEWTSSDGWTGMSVEPYASHWYAEPGRHSMTVNASNVLRHCTTSVNFTVHRRTEARVTYSQVPLTAVAGQIFVLSVSMEANTYSVLHCSLFLDAALIGNVTDADAVMRRRGRYAVTITAEVSVDSGKHRLKLLAADIALNETRMFFWFIDAFDAITDVVIDPASSAITTGSTTSFIARHSGDGETVTYLWNFGDQSTPGNTSVSPLSPAHVYPQPGTYTVRVTATNNVSRATGTATVNVVDAISGVMLAYDGPTTLGDDTYIKVVARSGTQVTYSFLTLNATTLAMRNDDVLVRYWVAGRYEVTVLAHNAVSNGSASLFIYVVDVLTLFIVDVGNATCGLPLYNVVTFHADVVSASASYVMFHWSIPMVLNSSGRGLSSVTANFTVAGVYDLTVIAWNDAVGVRSKFKRQLCVNESVPKESPNLREFNIGISYIGAPFIPAKQDVVFFPIISRCKFICSFHWHFWDSMPPIKKHGLKVKHAFQKTGLFNISLTVTKLNIQKTTYAAVIVKRRIEKAFLSAAVQVSSVDEAIEFVVVATPDKIEAENLTYYWSFYDGLNARYVGNSSAITYAFKTEGIHHVIVTVHNNVSSATANTTINICGKISGLTFTGCCARVFNTTVQFEPFVQTGQVSNYQWTLWNEDNVVVTTSEELVFVHEFAKAGYYKIQLSAENPLSNQTITDYFTVQVSCTTNLRKL